MRRMAKQAKKNLVINNQTLRPIDLERDGKIFIWFLLDNSKTMVEAKMRITETWLIQFQQYSRAARWVQCCPKASGRGCWVGHRHAVNKVAMAVLLVDTVAFFAITKWL